MSELIFIRHGQASFGRGDYDILSERGREQSLLIAEYLINTCVSFDRAYSGTLKRQVDTAEAILDYMRANTAGIPGLIRTEGLNEYQSEGIMHHYVTLLAQEDSSLHPLIEKMYTDKRAFQHVFDRVMTRWLSDDSKPEGVEGWNMFKERVGDSIKHITGENGKDSRIIIFSSGGVISAAIHIATGMSPYESIRIGWGLVNTSITKFRYGSSGLILHSFNNYPHLENFSSGELITYR
ncbi:MAG: histidine phosphatase family protein [Syntrophomonadaceae bacterium]|nr:histidine phosphatase family protein [Syntrophomonadaceae bacterium]